MNEKKAYPSHFSRNFTIYTTLIFNVLLQKKMIVIVVITMTWLFLGRKRIEKKMTYNQLIFGLRQSHAVVCVLLLLWCTVMCSWVWRVGMRVCVRVMAEVMLHCLVLLFELFTDFLHFVLYNFLQCFFELFSFQQIFHQEVLNGCTRVSPTSQKFSK